MKKRTIKYGGALTTNAEVNAIIKSVKKSHKTRNWQQAEEGALLEKEAAKYLGVKHGILTNSGSSAALLALSAFELPKDSEVIICAVTFPTVFNVIPQCDLVPVVVDAKIGTYGFNVDEVEKAITPKTKAIIAIHPVGNPVDMPHLMRIARKYKLRVIEDNCDGWGSTINGRKVGSFGDISITSFHAAHIVSMGVGGGVFTSNKGLAKKVRMYRDWGRQANTNEKNKYKTLPKDYNPRFIYEKIGYNFQILELQAAMGRVQLRKSDKIKKIRQKNFNYIFNHLMEHDDLILPHTVEGADVCWFAFPITTRGNRGELVKYLENHGIETRSMFAGNIIRHPAYKNTPYHIGGSLAEADYILHQSFWISCHPALSKDDLKYIVDVFDNYYAKKKLC